MTTKVKGQYALVVYEKSEKSARKKGSRGSKDSQTYYDVLDLTVIPKNHRVIGDRTRVTWVDQATKKSSCHYVVVKKISGNRDELLNMCPVDAATGEVASAETRIFTGEIHDQRKELQTAKKADNIARSIAREEVEQMIATDRGIWSNAVPFDNSSINRVDLSSFGPSEEAVLAAESSTCNTASTPTLLSTKNAMDSSTCNISPISPSLSTKDLLEEASCDEMYKTHDEGKITKPDDIIFWASMKSLAAVATPDNIAFLDSVVTSLKASLISSSNVCSLTKVKPSYEIPERYKKPGKDKVPIFDGIDFYLLSGVKSAIQTRSYFFNKVTRNREKSWKLLVRQCLLEVYASHLGEYSAKGTKENQRPAINADLYKGLLYWAKEWYGDEVDEDDYMIFINKTAYNKRKASRQTTSQKIIENAGEDSTQSTSPGNSCEKRRQRKASVERVSKPASRKSSPESVKKTSQNVDPKPSTSVEKVSQKVIRETLTTSAMKDSPTVSYDRAPTSVEPYPQNASQQQFQQFDGTRSAVSLFEQSHNQTFLEPSEKGTYPVPSDLPPPGSVSCDPHHQYYQNPWSASYPSNAQYFNNYLPTHYENPQYFQYPSNQKINYPLQNRGHFEKHPVEEHFETVQSSINAGKSQTSTSPRSRYSDQQMDYTNL